MVKWISVLLADEGKEHAFFPFCQGRGVCVGIGNAGKVCGLSHIVAEALVQFDGNVFAF